MNVKTDEEIPVRFELSINGEYIATGGVRYGVQNVILDRIARAPGSRPSWSNLSEEEWYREDIHVSLGGLGGSSNLNQREHTRWAQGEPLQVGDEVLVRILGPGSVDEPISRTHEDEAFRKRHQPASSDGTRKTELKELANEFENAQFGLLGNVNAPVEEFERSRSQYEYATNRLLSALIGAASEAEGDGAFEFQMRQSHVRNTMQVFLGILLAYREKLGLTNADKT